ncbi:MAG: RNA methyltransferase [Verrucomicrobiaceae bacterium]|nr:RNA methyltransferase [Verrucomicrobiaceae bacterium]
MEAWCLSGYLEGMLISSSSNERIKLARRVRDGRERDWIFVEGERLTRECLVSGLKMEMAFASVDASAEQEELLRELRCPVFRLPDTLLESLGDTISTQGIIVIAERPWASVERLLAVPHPLIVGLDRVQDPGNVGTIIRTAEAAGASGLLSFAGSADAFSPKTLRSAMGSAFRLPVMVDVAGAGALSMCRGRGMQCVAACGEGEVDYDGYDWRQPALLILGNEGRGVDSELARACDTRVRIPLRAPVESLNVAAAGAAILFEAARQRRQGR